MQPATGYADLGYLEHRCIMLLLPVLDLLRLSATSRGHRADLLRLMQGDLSVQLSITPPSAMQGRDYEASFRAFLQAGGGPLVKSVALEIPPPVSPTQLLYLHLSFPKADANTSPLLECIGGAAIGS